MTRIGFLFALAMAGGCVHDELELAENEQGIIALNQITLNALTMNMITFNGMNLGNGLNLGNGIDLDDPDAHLFVAYLVSCALPADAEVTIQGEPFAGSLGLAPEWADGPCGGSCQRWVSACLLARVNARGERVAISMRGPHHAMHPGPRELVDFPVEDGTFFGNLFASPMELFAASPRDNLALPRTCGDTTDCPLEILGHSDDVCASSTPALGRIGCPSDQAVTVYLGSGT